MDSKTVPCSIVIDRDAETGTVVKALLELHFPGILPLRGSFSTMRDGLKATRTFKPQLVFVDSDLLTGAESAEFQQLLSKRDFEVIFVSGDEQFAFQAFQLGAMDYLIKPIRSEYLLRSVTRLVTKIPVDNFARKLENLLMNLEQLKQYTPPRKLMVPTIAGFELLPVVDIIRCESDINYTILFLRNSRKLVVAKTLKDFEILLSELNFFRIHNSHLVNLAYVKSYRKGKGGSVVLIDNTELEVSTRRKDDFLKRLATV